MVDPKDKGVGITHDGYLKVYQLSKPTITGFDCLLIDEAQDCTPGMISSVFTARIGRGGEGKAQDCTPGIVSNVCTDCLGRGGEGSRLYSRYGFQCMYRLYREERGRLKNALQL